MLYISALGTAINSSLLSSYLVVGEGNILCILLVDLGYTGLACMDFQFAICNNIPLSWLVKKKPLYLVDSVLLL
jgi:hypothetical protein